jgi:hypothetical protein
MSAQSKKGKDLSEFLFHYYQVVAGMILTTDHNMNGKKMVMKTRFHVRDQKRFIFRSLEFRGFDNESSLFYY